ncbi:alpha/beta hydrolase family protein [Paenibacillus koleovorans]|uniref:alpha/beta hydrolase family protein n=1 Tax=Paenibacillus koleovorans TaxID=121608 RepID=UPI000FD6E7BC|nr:prolyl oligopeptidase family serine peptidase [Paenibacillus koleovorans]
MFEQYEDSERLSKSAVVPFRSAYQDYLLYASSVTPGIRLGMNVIKPKQPGHLLVQLHGWHMSMPKPERREGPSDCPYLIVQVDMRGRAFSEGEADCNGLELVDIYDAVQSARLEYSEYLLPEASVYLEGGSGGGGNVLAAIAKFPDLFAAATALYGISDYARWYNQDQTGEFRDDMDIWIGCRPEQDMERYQARSGIHLAVNLITPLYIAHGSGDIRVPVTHSRDYVEELVRLGKAHLVRYDELTGVGARGHLANATADQLRRMAEASERNRREHRSRLQLPPRGILAVGGYLYTRLFRIMLDNVNALAVLEYDADMRQIRVSASQPYGYRMEWLDGQLETGHCAVQFPLLFW